MLLKEKYKHLIDAATVQGITNLQMAEQDNVLHISGNAPTGAAKDALWDVYGTIDPNFSAGDLVLDIDAGAGLVEGAQLKVTTTSSNLNIRKEASTEGDIVGKAKHGEIVTFVSKQNDQWWLVKTKDGEEGYAFSTYLTPIG
jgi:uncharacterized protein YgiM (DUF1202 family)